MSSNIKLVYDEDRRIYSNIAFVEKDRESDIKYYVVADIGEGLPRSYLIDPADDIIDYDEQGKPIRIKDCMRYSKRSDIHPSFRRQWKEQLLNRLEELVGMDLSDWDFEIYANWYREPINYQGWSYREMQLTVLRPYAYIYLTLKWRSLDKNREYIRMDESVKSGDIEFDICFESYPIKVREPKYNKEYLKKIILNAKREKQKKDSMPRKKAVKFPYEFSVDCKYPDVLFTLYYKEAVTDESVFIDLMEEWNAKNEEEIHFVMNAEEILPLRDANTISIVVDFGGCDPLVIEHLIKYLQQSGLDIIKAKIS